MMSFVALQRRHFLVALLGAGLLLTPAIVLGGWALLVRASGDVHEVGPDQGRMYDHFHELR
jgi:hypothetical protein